MKPEGVAAATRELKRADRARKRMVAADAVTTQRIAGGALQIGWQPRTMAGLAWIDGAGDPSLADRRFLISVVSAAGDWSGEIVGAATVTIDAAATAALGHGLATISVSEAGVSASSRPAIFTFTL